MKNLKKLEQKYQELGKEIEALKKQNTLEEVAEKYSENWEEITGLDYENTVPSEVNKLDFINGAKWQQERMYSEEDIINALHSVELIDNKDYSKIYSGMKEWFEQFKKK